MPEDVPHPLDVERLQVAGAIGVRDQSLLNLRVVRLPQRQPQVEPVAHQHRVAHLISHERAGPPEATEIGHGKAGRGRDVGGDVEEHLL